MKEIEFRGIDENTEKWVYGQFMREKIGSLILPCIQIEKESDSGDYVEARPIKGETLGQYTGFRDKNKNRIYEGDIIRIEWDNEEYTNETVTYCENEFGFNYGNNSLFEIKDKVIEVIGNIYPKKVHFISDEVGEVFSYAGE